jgi:hypothetical protein
MKKQKRKGRQFNLIVLPEDLKLWRQRAEASHMTLSEWMRWGLNNTPTLEKPDPRPVTDDDEAP